MGTASQSFTNGDPNESKLVDELNRLLEGSQQGTQLNEDNRKGLEQAFKEAVTQAIFGPGADAITKDNVSRAVQSKVMNDILREYKQWKAAGSDMNKWPFSKKQNPVP
jgi:hypothetical protein